VLAVLNRFFEKASWPFCFALTCALLLMAATGSAQPVHLQTTTVSVSRANIVVMPFRAAKDSAFAGQLPSSLRGIVDGDLGYCGYFNVTEPQDLVPDTIVQVRKDKSGNWDTLRTYSNSTVLRVEGNIAVGWNGALATIGIYQPQIKTPIHSKEFSFKTEDLRPAGHQIAAWITKMVTGEDGSFSAKIVFAVRGGSAKNLWIMDWDGANPHPLTSDNTTNMSPSWAPNGQTIYFTSFRAGNASLYKLNLATGHITPFVVRPGVTSAASVSLDGQWVAYSATEGGNQEIFRCHPDGTGSTQLTFSYGIDTSPSWSPTGRDLVFTSDRTGEPQVYRMDLDGANTQRLSMQGNYNETGRWSPRGDLIAFASREIGFQIFTIAPDGSGERRITGDAATVTGGWALDPSWSPDGMKLAFTTMQGGKSAIWTCNWDGSNPRQLTFGMDASQPQWGPVMQSTDSTETSSNSR
jgi:TolB protein